MFRSQPKYLYLALGLIFLVSSLAGYLAVGYFNRGLSKPGLELQNTGQTPVAKPVITEKTLIKQEIQYLCGTKEEKQIPAKELVGLDYQGLKAKFPPEEGWFIDDTAPGTILLLRQVDSFCPKHGAYRHLGVDHGYLAVFQGPLGNDEIILSREDIPLDFLPADLRAKLQLAREYNRQPEKVKGELREILEFPNEEKLNEAMQNFDEYRE